jgi:hypothetical protein
VGEQSEIAVEYRISAEWRRLQVGTIGDRDKGRGGRHVKGKVR